MDTHQLNKALGKYKNFNGVFARDQLAGVEFKLGGYVINTDPSNKPGEHWVAVFFNDSYHGEYFDSFGFPPLHRDIINFLDEHSIRGWTYNSRSIQNILSVSCGYFCYLFLSFRFNDLSMQDFQDFFVDKSLVNELLLSYYYDTLEL